ncbi:MAG: tetratricopeptide repeat protein, partial [Lachnospiraceae bacterium]|nr:tetratricopeptide repeat protein [Lachnospiraceae bacterium]
KDAKLLRERFPANFVYYIVGRCERGEDLEFDQFEGADDGEYDLFLEYYDRCWQALREEHLEEAENCIRNADKLNIRHPVMEISRANLMLRKGKRAEALALMEEQRARYPKDAMICYNFAELFWMAGQETSGEERAGYREKAAECYRELKESNDSHYMANVRLTEWYYDNRRYREAKKCAEKVLAAGSDDAFLEILRKVNRELELELEERYRATSEWEPALELCWCYLQDGKITQGLRLALSLEKLLPPEKEAEYYGLLAKLYVEQAEYMESIAMTRKWETLLKEKIEKRAGKDEAAEKKDRDRLRQAHLIRMQCYHNLGFEDRENFLLALEEGESILTGGAKDVGILLEKAQIYLELEEYEKSLELSQQLADEYQVFAAFASSLEVYRRQLNAGGVIKAASQCIRYFPNFPKSYEYMAKVYLDLDRREDMKTLLEDAEKNGVKSVILDAYAYQMEHGAMEISELNGKLKVFRENFLKYVEIGKKGFYEKGLPVLTEYLYNYPDDFMLVERAIFHRAAHHHKEAREDFEKALLMNPANPYALNGLSFVHKYLGEYEKALFFIKKAILYMDKEMSPVIYADMGNLYSLLGEYEKALLAYRQYESLAGEIKSSWFWENLADYHLRTGRTGEAAAIYERFYRKNRWTLYEKLTGLYQAAGEEEKARRTLRQWGKELRADLVQRALKTVFSGGGGGKKDTNPYLAYYNSKGWMELLFGDGVAAVKAFEKMFGNGMASDSMEGKICDMVFACILCGDDKRGRKYAGQLRHWLEKEKTDGSTKYYNREKGHLQIEFLAAYYTEDEAVTEEILERESRAEICHFCTCPLCKEMEGARILWMLRKGQREEAEKVLRRNLEIQPWDEYMLAIKHVAFGR